MNRSFPKVLVVAFNRPESLAVLLHALKEQGVSEVYFAVDGPRADRPDDIDLVARTKGLIQELYHPTPERCLFQEVNLGVRKGPEAAITWFFSNEEEGVILEDDCIPGDSFLPFAAWALNHYRNEPLVMVVSGFNGFGAQPWKESHRFVQTPIIWGWATWRRAWCLFDSEISASRDPRVLRNLRGWVGRFPAWDFWREAAKMVRDGRLKAWDVAWGWTVLSRRGLVVYPRVNLVRNIGFGADASHTFDVDTRMTLPAESLAEPYAGPSHRSVDWQMQETINRREFWRTNDTLFGRIRSMAKAVRRTIRGY